MDPTAMVHITLGTIDTSNGQNCILGMVVFPLFMDKKTKMPIINNGRTKRDMLNTPRVLHIGAYQMPVYCQYPPDTAGKISYQNFMALDRLPTTSVLIRVEHASQDENGNFIS